MLRLLFSIGLLLPTLAGAEARGFRFHFSSRPRSPVFHHTDTKVPTVVPLPRFGGRTDPGMAPLPVSSPDPGSEIYTYMPPIPRKQRLSEGAAPVDLARWCNNGLRVGTGTGFCVVKVRADEPS